MRCTAKNADESPCTAEATTSVLSNGRIVYVCALHNGMMSKAVQQSKKYRPGQSGLFQKHDGTEFKERRQR